MEPLTMWPGMFQANPYAASTSDGPRTTPNTVCNRRLISPTLPRIIYLGDKMAEAVSIEELLISSIAQTDALAKLLMEKGVITQQEFIAKIAAERATYQRMLNPTRQ